MKALLGGWSAQSPPWLVRLHDGKGRVRGAGCLVERDLVVTCAHVVAKTVGLGVGESERPADLVDVQFPNSASDEYCRAFVVEGGWFPAAGGGAEQPGDVALLRLQTPAPVDALPAPLGPPVSEWHAIPFYAFGFPEHAAGTSVTGVIAGPAGPDGGVGLAGVEWAKLEGVQGAGSGFCPVSVARLSGTSGSRWWPGSSSLRTLPQRRASAT